MTTARWYRLPTSAPWGEVAALIDAGGAPVRRVTADRVVRPRDGTSGTYSEPRVSASATWHPSVHALVLAWEAQTRERMHRARERMDRARAELAAAAPALRRARRAAAREAAREATSDAS